MTQVPLAPPPPSGNANTDRWWWLLWRRLTQSGQIIWGAIDTSGSNLTDITTRNHNDLQTIQGGAANDYYHLTQTQRDDLIGAGYVTINHAATTLTGERVLTDSTGITLTDAGAGASLTISLDNFVGDGGTGGFKGGVPAPSSGDGDALARKFLCADGLWRIPTSADIPSHNGLADLEGGINEGVFEETAFETTAFQQGVVQFYHLTQSDYDFIVNQKSILSVDVDTTLTDSAYTCLVTASAKTITLPEAIASRYGREWTIIQNCTGYIDIEPQPTDEFILPGGSDTIRLDQIGSSLTVRCVSATQWVIV